MGLRHGWKLDRVNSRLDFYYNGARIGGVDAGGIDLAAGLTFDVDGTTATASTLDAAYNGGKEIAVDSTAVLLTGTAAATDVLKITAATSASCIDLTQAGAGKDIDGTGSSWSVALDGEAAFTNVTLTAGTVPAATLMYIAADNGGDLNLNAYTGKSMELRVAGTNLITMTGTAITLAQAVTISTGGLTCGGNVDITGSLTSSDALTVSAGTTSAISSTNINLTGIVGITGATTITGTLTVSGALTWGGATTIGESLTVDELVLDTDGATLGAAVCGLWRDNSGDASFQAVAGKLVKLVIANTTEMQIGNTGTTVNEGGGDRDFRVESNNLAYALYVDGALDCVVVGDNTNISDVDYRLMVGNVAKTLVDNQSASILYVAPTGATTESGTGATTHGYISTAYFAEPNITHGGTSAITVAATVYIADAPTEGSANAALYIASGGLTVAAGALTVDGGAVTFNDASADLDFRVESDGLQYALYVDGAKDCVVVGDNTDISDIDYRLMVGNVAKTLASGQSASILYVAPTGSTTEFSSGTHAYIATAYFAEPDITHDAGGTITIASTVHIADAPTEGAANYALYIGTGAVLIASGALTLSSGTVTISSGDLGFTAASDITIAAATAAALEISDGTTKFYAIDTRVTTSTAITHAFDISDYTIASASGAVATGMSLADHTFNYTGNTQVTTQVDTVVLGNRTFVSDTATLTIDEGNTLLVVAPTESTNITLTAASAIRIINTGGTPVNQYGIYIEDLTVGATTDVGIYIAGADTAAIYVAADPIHLADNVIMGFGTGTGVGAYDASIYYSNADLVINPDDIGTGNVKIGAGLLIEAGDTIQSDGAAEIAISVDNAAITVGSAGSMVAPYLSSTDNAFSDAIGGDNDGCFGFLLDTDGPTYTLEARFNSTWYSVALAGFEIQGKTGGGNRNLGQVWHDNQIIGEGEVDETICTICGKKMNVQEPVVLYPNYERGSKRDGSASLHCIFAHLKCAQ